MKKIWEKIKSDLQTIIARCYIDEIAVFILAWIFLFDLIGGTLIPLAYGNGCGWFAVPNLIIDGGVMLYIYKVINDGHTY